MNRAEAIRIVAMLQGAYPHRQIPDSTAEVYALTLGDMPYAEVKTAVTRLIQTSKFMPSIAEIRESVAEERCQLPAPEVAWGEVQRAISRVGGYFRPVFECQEIDEAVQVLGWTNICQSTNPAADRARFVEAYRSLREQRMELEATGRYVPSERQLPEQGGPGHGHGSPVLVRSRGRAALEAAAEQKQLAAGDGDDG